MKTSVTKTDINNVIAILQHGGAAMVLGSDIKRAASRYAEGTGLDAAELAQKVTRAIKKMYN